MTKLYSFVRHQSGACLGFALLPLFLFYAYSCQSVVVSTVYPNRKITRPELVAEVDLFLSQAAAKFDDLDRQDLVKDTIFNSVLDLAQGKAVNPIGVAVTLASILGLGAAADNIRKTTHLNTLKGNLLNGKVKEKIQEILKPTPN